MTPGSQEAPVLLLDRGGEASVVGPNGHKLTLNEDRFRCSACSYTCPICAVKVLVISSIESLKTLLKALPE